MGGSRAAVTPANILGVSAYYHDSAVALAALAERIRGYGHVKAKSARAIAAEKDKVLSEFRSATAVPMPTAA